MSFRRNSGFCTGSNHISIIISPRWGLSGILVQEAHQGDPSFHFVPLRMTSFLWFWGFPEIIISNTFCGSQFLSVISVPSVVDEKFVLFVLFVDKIKFSIFFVNVCRTYGAGFLNDYFPRVSPWARILSFLRNSYFSQDKTIGYNHFFYNNITPLGYISNTAPNSFLCKKRIREILRFTQDDTFSWFWGLPEIIISNTFCGSQFLFMISVPSVVDENLWFQLSLIPIPFLFTSSSNYPKSCW